MVRTSRKIPTDWTKYQPIGATIEGSRIFAFKTPLLPELQTSIPKECRFSTLTLFQQLAFSNRSLGLVINCNNTKRYFCRRDIEGLGICYKEIPCPGRGFLYRTDAVKTFIKTIDDFLELNSDNDLLIAVCCSNGINRSGYLICNYLINRLGWSSHDALNAFENARGYSIERGSYVQALHKVDRERRSKTMPFGLDRSEHEMGNDEALPAKTDQLLPGISDFNPQLTAQMMQQFFNMEQEFKQVAETTAHSSANSSPALVASTAPQQQSTALPSQKSGGANSTISARSSFKINAKKREKIFNQTVSSSSAILNQSDIGVEQAEIGNTECVSDEEYDEDDSSSPNIDFDSMGRIDTAAAISKSQMRRQRRQKREKMFAVMKRGHFWEINEMRKEMQE
ncbi:hypothetical protein niasHS_010229 [Heterodera schachtii]|uniref:Tyrosine specific protein phosphatases domain-containing protein n=1 Tax=Heterodera schachtii TaxID=97005 RepID=A0ABD2J453_HETSC